MTVHRCFALDLRILDLKTLRVQMNKPSGCSWDNGKENGDYRNYRGYTRIIGCIYWGHMGIMENEMETTT